MKISRLIAAAAALAILGGGLPCTGGIISYDIVTADAVDHTTVEEDDIKYNIYSDHAELVEAAEDLTGSIVIPDKVGGKPVTVICDKAFYSWYTKQGMKALTGISIPDTVEKIGSYAFSEAGIKKLKLPAALKEIGSYAFCGCEDLESAELPEGLEVIGEYAFSGSKILPEISIPGTVKEIHDQAFSYSDALTSVTIPAGVETMGDGIFTHCTGLKKAVFEKGVKYVPANFASFTPLSEVVLPEGITAIYYEAFEETKLEKIEIPAAVKNIGTKAFNGSCLRSVTVPEGVEALSDFVFNECSFLSEVNLPSTLKTIGKYALSGCNSLEGITLPPALEKIGEYAFYDSGLKSISLPNSVVSVGDKAFSTCTDLERIDFRNPDCSIAENPYTISNNQLSLSVFDGTIYGYAGSTAEQYAKRYDYKFALLGSDPEITTAPATTSAGTTPGPGKETAPAGTSDIPGDVNGDGLVDANDASLILEYYAYTSTGGELSSGEYFAQKREK